MHPHALSADCFCCDAKLHFAPDSDHGQVIERYGIVVCTPCFQSSLNGWKPHHEGRLLQQLAQSRIAPPTRNAQGLLPRD